MAQDIDLITADPDKVSPLNLAFIGDSVYEVIIRNKMLAECNGSVKDVSLSAAEYTNAAAQCSMIHALEGELTEREIRIYKRGRNAKSLSAPKSCTVSQYRHATGLEALIGYLFLSGEYERMTGLVDRGVELLREKRTEK